jgi:hypothetical protein
MNEWVSAEEITYMRKELLETTIYELQELDLQLSEVTTLAPHWRRTAKDVQDIMDADYTAIANAIRSLIVKLKEVQP